MAKYGQICGEQKTADGKMVGRDQTNYVKRNGINGEKAKNK